MSVSTRRGDFAFTSHAILRAMEFGFPLEQVLEAVYDPETMYVSYSPSGVKGQTRQRGEIAVIVNLETNTIITVLPRKQEDWIHDDARKAG